MDEEEALDPGAVGLLPDGHVPGCCHRDRRSCEHHGPEAAEHVDHGRQGCRNGPPEPRPSRHLGHAAVDRHPPGPGHEHRQRPYKPDRSLADNGQPEQQPDASGPAHAQVR